MRQAVKRACSPPIWRTGTTPIIASTTCRLEDICDHVGLLSRKGGILLSRELDDMKLNIHKLQCVLQPGPMSAEEIWWPMDKLNVEQRGSLITLVVRGTCEGGGRRLWPPPQPGIL